MTWYLYYIVMLIRSFGNHCLSAIGGGKQWSPMAGLVQLLQEAAPGLPGPLVTGAASATLCAHAAERPPQARIMRDGQYIDQQAGSTSDWFCWVNFLTNVFAWAKIW